MSGPMRPCKVCKGSGTYHWYESMGELGSIPHEDPCHFCRGKGYAGGQPTPRVYIPKAERCVYCEYARAVTPSRRCEGCHAAEQMDAASEAPVSV